MIFTKKWWAAAGIRALKTVAQTAIATIGTSALIESVNWLAVLSASALAGVLIVHESGETLTLDKTWKEIHDALQSGLYVVIVIVDHDDVSQYIVHAAFLDSDVYTVRGMDGIQVTVEYNTDTENGYPTTRA